MSIDYPISFVGRLTVFLFVFTCTSVSVKYMHISNFKSLSINGENLE